MKKKKFRVVWQIQLEKEVYAKDAEEAKEIVENLDCQYDGSYVSDSFEHVKQEELKFEPDYKAGFYILMEYWDSLPDEEKIHIDERLKEVGL